MKSLLLQIVDCFLLEPVIRFLFPEPASRGIGIRTIYQGKGKMRLLCLSGAFCSNTAANWKDWIKDLRRTFPDADIVTVNGFYFYWPDEVGVIEQVIAEGQRILADRRPTIIIGFSFGGLLAKAMVARSDAHDVRAIVSLATEHRGHLPQIAHMRDVKLGVPLDIDLPLYTFGGWLDVIVWPWTTFTDRSSHHFFVNGHFAFIRSRNTRAKVLRALQGIITRHFER